MIVENLKFTHASANTHLVENVLKKSFAFNMFSKHFYQHEHNLLGHSSKEDVLNRTVIFILVIRLLNISKRSFKSVFKKSS